MSYDLSTVVQTAGVRAVALFDANGECMAQHVPPPYEPILLWDAASKLGAGFDFFSGMGQPITVGGFAAHCEDGYFVLRQMGDLVAIVLAGPAINPSMLSVALNVLGLNVTRASRGLLTPADGLGTRNTPVPQPAATPRFAAPVRDSGPPPAPFVLTPPPVPVGAGEISEPPPDAVDPEAVREMLHMLQRVAGPAAKLLLKQELGRMNVSVRTLRRGQWAEFVEAVGRRIPDAEKRQSFAAAARPLVS